MIQILQTRKKSRILVACLVIGLTLAATLLLIRSRSRSRPPTETLERAKPNLAYLSLLNSDQLLAKVEAIELRSQDLKDFLQLDFHGQLLHGSMSSEDLSLRIASGLDQLIEEELLAQEAKKRGMKTSLEGAQARRDLSGQYFKSELAKLSAVSDPEVQEFLQEPRGEVPDSWRCSGSRVVCASSGWSRQEGKTREGFCGGGGASGSHT